MPLDGELFGGSDYIIRLLNRDGEKHLLLEFDGIPARPQTYRGLLRLLARRLVATSPSSLQA